MTHLHLIGLPRSIVCRSKWLALSLEQLGEMFCCATLAVMLTPKAVGHAAMPRELACCEVTVNLPSFTTAKSHGDHCESAFIVDDLTQHPDLKNRPYVTGFPSARYYAGVPIT